MATKGEPLGESFNLERFTAAQRPVYHSVLEELGRGRKRGHWMWFIFPQLKGLGRSSTAAFYGISGIEEAIAYLRHPLLGARLRECTSTVNGVEGKSAEQIFGAPDWLKFRSSMTLFSLANSSADEFGLALQRYFNGISDPLTMEILGIHERS